MGDGAPMTVRVAAGSHRVEVVAIDGATFAVDGKARVTHGDHAATIDEARSKLKITVPADADLVVGTTSGRVSIAGRARHVAVVSESGRVEIVGAASVDVRTQSSAVQVGAVAGACRIRSGSGKVQVDRCGSADVASESSRVEMNHVDGVVDAHSVSGRIALRLEHPHDVRAETVTGRIEVSLPRGTVAFRPDGPTDRRLRPPDAACTVTARSETGKVVVATR